MATSAMTVWQSGMTVGPSNNDPKFEGMNPTAGVTSSKLKKEKSVAIPAENGIFCRFRSRPQMSQKSSYDNKGTIKMTVYIHVTLTSDLSYKTFLNSNYYYTTADIVTMQLLLQ